MNRWHIPEDLEGEIRRRDRSCIYCGKVFADATSRGQQPSWEHIVNDASMVTRENIALCCISCNASKGTKDLSAWLDSKYCRRRGITAATLAPVAQRALGRARPSR